MSGAEIARTVTPPPTPWIMRGRLWASLQRHEGDTPPLPFGLHPHFTGHRVVALVRYLEGTLRYDELILGRVARRGFTVGLFVDHIWVDSRESVAGGRVFWGLPKELAEFQWTGDCVSVRDAEGEIATLSANQEAARTPEITVSTLVSDEGLIRDLHAYPNPTTGNLIIRSDVGMQGTNWQLLDPLRVRW